MTYLTLQILCIIFSASKGDQIIMDSLLQFTQELITVKACLKCLEVGRWADGTYCPHCDDSERIYCYSDGKCHKYGERRRVFHIRCTDNKIRKDDVFN